jgi:hypothetical protein
VRKKSSYKYVHHKSHMALCGERPMNKPTAIFIAMGFQSFEKAEYK